MEFWKLWLQCIISKALSCNNMFISDPTSLNIDDVVSEDSDDNMFNEQKGWCMCTQLEPQLMVMYHRCQSSVSLIKANIGLGNALPFSESIISSSGRRCPNVFAKPVPVPATLLAVAVVPNVSVMSFSHLYLVFPMVLFSAIIPCIIGSSKPLCRVTWPTVKYVIILVKVSILYPICL